MQEYVVSSEEDLDSLIRTIYQTPKDIGIANAMAHVAKRLLSDDYRVWMAMRIDAEDLRYEARVSKETEHCIDFPWHGRSWIAEDAHVAFFCAAAAIAGFDVVWA